MPDNILALDTTLPHISLWLRYQGEEINFEAQTSLGSSETVFNWLKKLSSDFPSLWEDLDAYGLNIGPGRFNGVRCGLSIIGTLSVLHPHKIYSCTTFDLMRAAAGGDLFAQYAVYAKKGHAYTQQGCHLTALTPFTEISTEGLCSLQCPELKAALSLDFVPISLIGSLIKTKQASCHESFETILPLYSALT